jgi:hypothetical protein
MLHASELLLFYVKNVWLYFIQVEIKKYFPSSRHFITMFLSHSGDYYFSCCMINFHEKFTDYFDSISQRASKRLPHHDLVDSLDA